MFPTKNCFEKYNKKIGHRPRKRDMMGQSCPIYVCTRDNHARYSSVHVTSCGGWKQFIEVILGRKLNRVKVCSLWNNII